MTFEEAKVTLAGYYPGVTWERAVQCLRSYARNLENAGLLTGESRTMAVYRELLHVVDCATQNREPA